MDKYYRTVKDKNIDVTAQNQVFLKTGHGERKQAWQALTGHFGSSQCLQLGEHKHESGYRCESLNHLSTETMITHTQTLIHLYTYTLIHLYTYTQLDTETLKQLKTLKT